MRAPKRVQFSRIVSSKSAQVGPAPARCQCISLSGPSRKPIHYCEHPTRSQRNAIGSPSALAPGSCGMALLSASAASTAMRRCDLPLGMAQSSTARTGRWRAARQPGQLNRRATQQREMQRPPAEAALRLVATGAQAEDPLRLASCDAANDCFTPESGHSSDGSRMAAFDPKRTFAVAQKT